MEEKKKWDKFVSTEAEAGSASEKHTDLIKKASVALKIITSGIVFLVVLSSGVIAKAATFFIVAQMNTNMATKRRLTICTGYNEKTTKAGNLEEDFVVYGENEAVAWLW